MCRAAEKGWHKSQSLIRGLNVGSNRRVQWDGSKPQKSDLLTVCRFRVIGYEATIKICSSRKQYEVSGFRAVFPFHAIPIELRGFFIVPFYLSEASEFFVFGKEIFILLGSCLPTLEVVRLSRQPRLEDLASSWE